jgi:hypothetical protein
LVGDVADVGGRVSLEDGGAEDFGCDRGDRWVEHVAADAYPFDNCPAIPEKHCMFIGSGVAFGLTPEPVVTDGHHSGAERGSEWRSYL